MSAAFYSSIKRGGRAVGGICAVLLTTPLLLIRQTASRSGAVFPFLSLVLLLGREEASESGQGWGKKSKSQKKQDAEEGMIGGIRVGVVGLTGWGLWVQNASLS